MRKERPLGVSSSDPPMQILVAVPLALDLPQAAPGIYPTFANHPFPTIAFERQTVHPTIHSCKFPGNTAI